MPEQWRSIPDYPNYEAGDLGRVRSLPREGTAGGILKPRLDRDGYPLVTVMQDGRTKLVAVHRLVALAFHGEKRNVLHKQVSHLDGTRTNARADNLKWVSHCENQSHKKLHGTHQYGEKNHRAKLTADQVLVIRASANNRRLLAQNYGVSVATIDDIRTRRRWRHI